MGKLELKEKCKIYVSELKKDGEIVSQLFYLYREFGNRFSKETLNKFKPYFMCDKVDPRKKMIPLIEEVNEHLSELLSE